MKRILGLDLGTNSIGWAVVNAEEKQRQDETVYLKPVGIDSAGSRIIPMSADILGDFDKGNSISQTAKRTDYRSARRLHERYLLRRERLLLVLKIMKFLPDHFANQIDEFGKYTDHNEPKLPWKQNADGRSVFLFRNSYEEMLADFCKQQPQLLVGGKKIPYDWTIYYLRKKALSQALTKEELAWVLLQFNQKRGYYQLRGEEEDNTGKLEEYYSLRVVGVENTGEKKGDATWYNVYLENGWVYKRSSLIPLDWVGKTKDFIATTILERDGTPKKDKDGSVKRSLRAPKEDDWTLLKTKTEHEIELSKDTVGRYIYDSLLRNPNQKIIGKLVRTVERRYYKDELRKILDKQMEFIPELKNRDLYDKCVHELYHSNEAHRNNISNWNFTDFFINDILFYQRPLKSKKSLIDNCPYELRYDDEGNEHPIKCIAKSNPYYQEFRLWQFVQNLRIYQREKMMNDGQLDLYGNARAGKLQTDVDVTAEFLKDEDDYTDLFDWLNDRPAIKQDTLLKDFFKVKKAKGAEQLPYRWNYVEDKEYPCNETRSAIVLALSKNNLDTDFLTKEVELKLWHILYSVQDKIEIGKALKTFAIKNGLDDAFVEACVKLKPFKKEYGAYSEKAIKKLLPLMRIGKYWGEDKIDSKTKERIDKIITGEYDDNIKNRVREKAINLTEFEDFKGLPLWLACYIVYGRHSEAKENVKWEKPEDIDAYLKQFQQHSLRNPIVEQVVLETLRTVRDIWKQVGQIDEIHVELGREMKNPADKRARMTEQINKNENTNLRIKAMLAEFANPMMGIENVRPYSPSQQDLLRIYEENALDNLEKDDKEFDFVTKMSTTASPSKSDILRYKLWLEQKYRSPYTGEMISLTKLFTDDYEIEHIIPQSLYFDDSLSNKVICESEVNKLKDRMLGFEFVQKRGGEKVQLSQGKVVEILNIEVYEKFVKEHYANNRVKMKKLLMDNIPDGFIERQLNDSRYISKVVKGLLSNIVREKLENGEYEQEAVSKNLITCNGTITDRLKKDWGMNDVWNHIILPRFQRLNEITGKTCFTTTTPEGHVIPAMPIELQKGFSKKRIDHRHHAMDAIVIACATRDHVNLLNNEAAHSKHNANRYQLQRKLRRCEKAMVNGKEQDVFKEFLKPWDAFAKDAQQTLEKIIVSFKQNLRVINKATNYYYHYDHGEKTLAKQKKGDSWAVRKSMHKDTVWGEVNLRRVKGVALSEALKSPKRIVNKDFKKKALELLAKGKDAKYIMKYVEDNKDVWSDINPSRIEVYYYSKETHDRYFATRFLSDLVGYFAGVKNKEDALKKINAITDTGIQKILKAHLQVANNNTEMAFSPDGIDELNKNIVQLNNGRFHQPIYKIRRYEKADKYPIGQNGSKARKFVEADKGTNLFFAVFSMENMNKETGEVEVKRSYCTIPLNVMIDCQKRFGIQWKAKIEAYLKEKELVSGEGKLLFVLSPNDLVYLPKKGDIKNGLTIDNNRIFKIVSFTGNRLYAVQHTVAKCIVDKVEYTQLNKTEFSDNKESIKEACVPVIVDRLGNVVELNGDKL